ncbi:MAG: hypothetical protein O2871_02460, partial [bacterium]|nr:hypothetical protein [bacterium]
MSLFVHCVIITEERLLTLYAILKGLKKERKMYVLRLGKEAPNGWKSVEVKYIRVDIDPYTLPIGLIFYLVTLKGKTLGIIRTSGYFVSTQSFG